MLMLLDVPGNTENVNTDRGKLVKELSDLIVFKPGIKMGLRQNDLGVVLGSDNERQWYECTTLETLEKVEALLKRYGVFYCRNIASVHLCCDAATAKAQTLYFFNYYEEEVILVASQNKLFSFSARAYIVGDIAEDERLERAVIESLIRFREENRDNPDINDAPTSFYFFPSREEAEQFIQGQIEAAAAYQRKDGREYGKEYDIIIVKDLFTGQKYQLPENKKMQKGMRVGRIIWSLPTLVKVYGDGKALVSGGDECLPLADYFDRKRGIGYFFHGACDQCFKTEKEKMRQHAREYLKQDNYWKYSILPIAEEIGYIFDYGRITFTRIKKHNIGIYKGVSRNSSTTFVEVTGSNAK